MHLVGTRKTLFTYINYNNKKIGKVFNFVTCYLLKNGTNSIQ